MNGTELGTLLLRPVVNKLSPGGRNAVLSILIYHRVFQTADPLLPNEVTAEQFRWQMRLISRYFNVLPLEEAVCRLRDGSLPARSACITFDDGYADNAEVALPILRETGVPATFFIATGYIDGGRMWNDTVIEAIRKIPEGVLDLTQQGLETYHLDGVEGRIKAITQLLSALKHKSPGERNMRADHIATFAENDLPDNLMMTSNQVKQLHSAGMTIGAHTVTHPILACMGEQEAYREIEDGRRQLEDLTGEKVELFAYPNGRPVTDYLPEHLEMVRGLGFKAAVSTVWGVSTRRTRMWELPRFTPWDKQPALFMARLLLNCLRRQHQI